MFCGFAFHVFNNQGTQDIARRPHNAPPQRDTGPRANERIRAPEIRLIGAEGENIGPFVELFAAQLLRRILVHEAGEGMAGVVHDGVGRAVEDEQRATEISDVGGQIMGLEILEFRMPDSFVGMLIRYQVPSER